MNRKVKCAIGATLLAICAWAFGHSPSDDSIRHRVVKLSGAGYCSGEQVRAPSGVDYILTAAHCKALERNGIITVETEDGKTLPRRVIAEDPFSDLLLLEGLPGVEGLAIAGYAPPRTEIRTFTHGRAFDTYKTSGVLIQSEDIKIAVHPVFSASDEDKCLSGGPKYSVYPVLPGVGMCVMSTRQMAMSALIVPGSSGGAVVNEDGELVGVVSASDGTFGYIVELLDIIAFLRSY